MWTTTATLIIVITLTIVITIITITILILTVIIILVIIIALTIIAMMVRIRQEACMARVSSSKGRPRSVVCDDGVVVWLCWFAWFWWVDCGGLIWFDLVCWRGLIVVGWFVDGTVQWVTTMDLHDSCQLFWIVVVVVVQVFEGLKKGTALALTAMRIPTVQSSFLCIFMHSYPFSACIFCIFMSCMNCLFMNLHVDRSCTCTFTCIAIIIPLKFTFLVFFTTIVIIILFFYWFFFVTIIITILIKHYSYYYYIIIIITMTVGTNCDAHGCECDGWCLSRTILPTPLDAHAQQISRYRESRTCHRKERREPEFQNSTDRVQVLINYIFTLYVRCVSECLNVFLIHRTSYIVHVSWKCNYLTSHCMNIVHVHVPVWHELSNLFMETFKYALYERTCTCSIIPATL